jgi:hypothetical protein
MRYLLCLLFACSLAHAQDDTLPDADDLMQLAFPKWSNDSEGRVQRVRVIPTPQGWAGGSKGKAEQRNVSVQPRFVTRIDSKRVALIAAMAPANEDGSADISHAQPLGIAAYVFQPSKAGWKLSARQEPFALRGFFGQADIVQVQLGQGKPAVLVEYGSCWQGYCNTWVSLYEFDAKGVRAAPVLEQVIQASNTGALTGCPERLSSLMPGMRSAMERDEDDERRAAAQRCIVVQGKLRIDDSGDIAIAFEGARSESLRGTPQPAEPVAQTMRFVYRNGKYETEDGANPAPVF